MFNLPFIDSPWTHRQGFVRKERKTIMTLMFIGIYRRNGCIWVRMVWVWILKRYLRHECTTSFGILMTVMERAAGLRSDDCEGSSINSCNIHLHEIIQCPINTGSNTTIRVSFNFSPIDTFRHILRDFHECLVVLLLPNV